MNGLTYHVREGVGGYYYWLGDSRGQICAEDGFTSKQSAEYRARQIADSLSGRVFLEVWGLHELNSEDEYPVLFAYPILRENRNMMLVDLRDGAAVGPLDPSPAEREPIAWDVHEALLNKTLLNAAGSLHLAGIDTFWARPRMLLQLYSERFESMRSEICSATCGYVPW